MEPDVDKGQLPLKVQEIFDLKSIGISKKVLKASRVGFESKTFITIREEKECAIIDTSRDFIIERMSMAASGILMHRSEPIIVLRAKKEMQGAKSTIVQSFNLVSKQKLIEVVIHDDIKLWKWISESCLGLVGKKFAYHLDISDK